MGFMLILTTIFYCGEPIYVNGKHVSTAPVIVQDVNISDLYFNLVIDGTHYGYVESAECTTPVSQREAGRLDIATYPGETPHGTVNIITGDARIFLTSFEDLILRL